jgi:hypothetical protein
VQRLTREFFGWEIRSGGNLYSKLQIALWVFRKYRKKNRNFIFSIMLSDGVEEKLCSIFRRAKIRLISKIIAVTILEL